MKSFCIKKWFGSAALMCLLLAASASTAYAAGAPAPSEISNPAAVLLVTVAVVLLLAIGLLSYVLIGAAGFYVERFKEKQKGASAAAKTVMLAVLCLFTSAAFAQADATEVAQEVVSTTIAGMQKSSFYMLTGVIALEVTILLTMLLFLKQLLAKDKPEVVVEYAEEKPPFYITWWNKLNAIRPVTEEDKIILYHDYDGIRELDNKLPPWWVYGFYACIIFSVVYLYRYHVAHSAPSTIQEYEIAMAKAEIEKEEYLKTAANKVDENTVTLLTDASALAEGQKIFTGACAACHGNEGQGTVGPNLTDEYWLHKGGVKDIFKTIKYGVPEKGMKAWREDYSPVQIAAIASYVKSLQGTKPANAKEPQGDIYKDEATAVTDTTSASPVNKLAKN